MGLEISIFENSAGQKQTAANQQPKQINLLAETVIPLESAIYSPNSEWWPLLPTNFNQQINTQLNAQINTQPAKPNVNTNLSANFTPIAQSGKQQLLTANQLQDRCVSAEYLCRYLVQVSGAGIWCRWQPIAAALRRLLRFASAPHQINNY